MSITVVNLRSSIDNLKKDTDKVIEQELRAKSLRAFADVKLTGIGGRTTDQAVVQNYMRIYNQLYDNMAGALKLAGVAPVVFLRYFNSLCKSAQSSRHIKYL